MDAKRWKQLETLFFTALELETPERSEFLEAACGDNIELRKELELMLNADQNSMAFALESKLLSDENQEHTDPSSLIGTHIGPYLIEKLIGEGGMGEVYLAQRNDDQFDQRVALKLVHPGYRNVELYRRFRMERQVLARLTHPNITQLLDGGIDDTGRPYFVMQYIEGVPITTFCDKNALSIEDRLLLFRTVCSAVQHAHGNLVVHRDLKPSNILVTEDGVVKLLDFGIAKLLDPDWNVSMAVTQSQVRLMTPEYAAPEQVKGEAITTTTDVYALGILLYEILSGRRPYQIKKRMQAEIERIICEEDPHRPSTAVTEYEQDESSKTSTPEAISLARRTGVSQLKKILQGDLDNIVMMALRKEQARRYVSAEQLSADIQRYLLGRPVAAQKDTVVYRVKKFVRRNRIAVAAVAIILISLASFTISTISQSRALEKERDKAQNEATKATQISDFLINLFEQADPNENQGKQVSVEDILREGAARIEHDLADQPEIQTAIMVHLGRVHRRLGLLDESTALYERSLKIRRHVFGGSHESVAHNMSSIAENLIDRGRFEPADSLLNLSLAIQREVLDAKHQDIAMTLNARAIIAYQKQNFDNAKAYFEEAINIWSANKGTSDIQVIMGYSALGSIYIAQKNSQEAEKSLLKALELADSLNIVKHIVRAGVMNNLGHLYMTQDKLREADSLLTQSLEMRRELLGNQHQSIPASLNNLAMLKRRLGNLEEAENLSEEGVALQRILGGPVVGRALLNQGSVEMERGKYAEAEASSLEALQILTDGFGQDHPLVEKARQQLDKLYAAWGKP